MVFTERDLEDRLRALHETGKKALQSLDTEFEEHFEWLRSVRDGLKNGSINVKTVLVPKTPGKHKLPLSAIEESLDASIELDEVRTTRGSTQNKRASRKAPTRKGATRKARNITVVEEEDEDIKICLPTRSQKRISEESVNSASKRLCGNRSSGTTSRDSGLSSVGSRNTRGSTLSGVAVKQETLTPKNTSVESTASLGQHDETYSVNQGVSITISITNAQADISSPPKKRSRSAGRGKVVVKVEPRSSSRSLSEPRTPADKRSTTGRDKTLVLASVADASTTSSPLKSTPQPRKQTGTPRSPVVKAPPIHLLQGQSVKKAVKAFEALNEDHESESGSTVMAPPTMAPPSKLIPPTKIVPPSKSATISSASSLDDALNAPTRITRTKTRAMAKAAAAADEKKTTKVGPTVSAVTKILKSPVHQQQTKNNLQYAEKKADDHHEKENATFTASKIATKPFGSASKQPQFFFKSPPSLNRTNHFTPSHSASTSFTMPRVNNLVTSVESFIQKPVVHVEVKPSREENLQKIVAKADVASKKKEEIIKAQMEEKMRKREEKRLKVCAAREAMEKEKQEMQLKLEREREEKQKQIQAEREEKLRQEYLKKKRLAQQKAAETEERRRQEEAARLAKLKQQEEEQRRLAAQRKKEQEEADRKQMERLQQEREAAAYRAKEAEKLAKENERLAKEAALKVKKTSKAQLDTTYDKVSPAQQSYGVTPNPEERKPLPSSNANNYGIDDANTDDSSEDESKPKKVVPLWAQSKQRVSKLYDDYEVTHSQMFAFFGSEKSTPDLSKIFTSIDRRQLIRKSSAVWRTPPVKFC